MKKMMTIILVFIIAMGNLYMAYANTKIEVTEKMAEKIAFPYNVLLQRGDWELLEYEETSDDVLNYKMRLSNGTISTVEQTKKNGTYVLNISENGLSNTIKVDIHENILEAVIEDDIVSMEGQEKYLGLNNDSRSYVEYRTSEPYYGSPRMYTNILGRNNTNVLLEDTIQDITITALVAAAAQIPTIGTAISLEADMVDFFSALKNLLVAYDPTVNAIYAVDYKIGLENPPTEGGYFKKETVFYYNVSRTEFAKATHLWARVLT